jgi:hypothetical protein
MYCLESRVDTYHPITYHVVYIMYPTPLTGPGDLRPLCILQYSIWKEIIYGWLQFPSTSGSLV